MTLLTDIQFRFFRGFMYGFPEKSAIIAVKLSLDRLPADGDSSHTWFSPQSMPEQQAVELVMAALRFKLSYFRRSKIPVFSSPRVHFARSVEARTIEVACAFTYWSAEASASFLRGIISELNRLTAAAIPVADWNAALERFCDAEFSVLLSRHRTFGTNNYHLLEAASKQNLEILEVSSGHYQLGFGPHARWFGSTQTDLTSGLGLSLVKNKDVCNAFLRRNGIPVPRQLVLNSREACAAALEQFSGAVVIKPADRDGGEGITSNLLSIEAVQAAYDEAVAVSKRVIMEAYADGNDYRLTFFRGEMCRSFGRRKQGVMGDGHHSVRELIEAHNMRKRVAQKKFSESDPIILNRLERSGLGLDDIPANGTHIVLGELHNVSVGGILFPVSEFQIHPDNIELASLVAKLVRLDIVGIDLITADIGRSWKETDLVITDVNGIPQIGSDDLTVFDDIVRKLARDNQPRTLRICTIAPDAQAIANRIERLVEVGYTVVANASLFQSGMNSGRPFQSTFEAAQHALNMANGRLHILMTVEEIARFGLPCCSFDRLQCDRTLAGHPIVQNLARWSAQFIRPPS